MHDPAGVVEDIIIVPVAIAYDKLLERRFVRHELMVGVVYTTAESVIRISILFPLHLPPPPPTHRVAPRGPRQ